MPFSDDEIMAKARILRDQGTDPNRIKEFIDVAKREQGAPAEAPASTDKRIGQAIDLGLEAGLPALAQLGTVEFSPVVQSVAGATAGSVGNALAQLRRMAMEGQKEFKYGENLEAATLSGIPFAGPAKMAERYRGLLGGAWELGKTSAKLGTAGMVGEAGRSLVDEQQFPQGANLAAAGLAPAIAAGATMPVVFVGQHASDWGTRVRNSIMQFSDSGVTPTPGMLLGGTAATTEQRLANASPGGRVAGKIDRTYEQISNGLNAIQPGVPEGARVWQDLQPLIGQIRKHEENISVLVNEAEKQKNNVTKLTDVAERARLAGRQDLSDSLQKEIINASDSAFTANVAALTERAKQIATARLVQGEQGMNPAQFRDEASKVLGGLKTAFEKHSEELYRGIDSAAPNFSTSPILARTEALATAVSGGVPKRLNNAVEMVKTALGDTGTASLDQLRFLRSEIANYARGSTASDAEKRLILGNKTTPGLANTITEEINKQAETAFGSEIGKRLKYANTFYAETIPAFQQKGVVELLESRPGDEYVGKLLEGMKKSGVLSDEYKNLQDLVVKIHSFSPGLASTAKGQINSAIRGAVIHEATTLDPITGLRLVDPGALSKTLVSLETGTPGTLKAVGFAGPEKVADLNKLLLKYPEAPKMGTQDWERLFSSPAFADNVGSTGVSQPYQSVASVLQAKLAASSGEVALMKSAQLKAAGKIEESEAALRRAKIYYENAGYDVAAAKTQRDAILQDPRLVALNNPGLPTSSFNAFKTAFFDPKASAVTNSDVGAIVSSLRDSKNLPDQNLLQKLRETYIADRIAAFKSAPNSSTLLKRPNVTEMSDFFNPVNPSDARNEIERARILLSPEQMDRLTQFAKVARQLAEYERLGRAGDSPVVANPAYGAARRIIDAAIDVYRDGKYSAAAALLTASPEKFAAGSKIIGDTLQATNTPAAQAALMESMRVGREKQAEEIKKRKEQLNGYIGLRSPAEVPR